VKESEKPGPGKEPERQGKRIFIRNSSLKGKTIAGI
jgi:hypothetical protein